MTLRPPRFVRPAAALVALGIAAACAADRSGVTAEAPARAPAPGAMPVADAMYTAIVYVDEQRTIGCGMHFSAQSQGFVQVEGSVNAFYDTGQAPTAMLALTVFAAVDGIGGPVPIVSAWLVTGTYGPTRDFRRLTHDDVPTYLAVNTTRLDALFLPAELVEGFRLTFVVPDAAEATRIDMPPLAAPEPYLTVDACLREVLARLDADLMAPPPTPDHPDS